MTYSKLLLSLILLFIILTTHVQDTDYRYLSGKGLGVSVTWVFYCSDGMIAGEWSQIEVPSQ